MEDGDPQGLRKIHLLLISDKFNMFHLPIGPSSGRALRDRRMRFDGFGSTWFWILSNHASSLPLISAHHWANLSQTAIAGTLAPQLSLWPAGPSAIAGVPRDWLALAGGTLDWRRVANVSHSLHALYVAVPSQRAPRFLPPGSQPGVGGRHAALAAAALGRDAGLCPALQEGAEPRVALVSVRAAGPVAERVADAAVRAEATRELHGGGVPQRGEEGEGKGTLALPQAFGGAQVGGGSGVRPGAAGGHGGHGLAVLLLDRLDLQPLQLQQPLQVLLQLAHGPGPGGAPALGVEEQGQLPEAPGVEGRGQEVRVAVAAVAQPARAREGRGEVGGVDDLGPQVEVRGGAGGGKDRKPLGIG